MSNLNRGSNPPWSRRDIGQGHLTTSQLLYNLQNVQQQLQQQQLQQVQYSSASLKMGLGSTGLGLGGHISAGASKGRVVTGTVTKLHDTFGFIDDEIFFQKSVVKGNLPKIGDRVIIEATYNPSMPFKWNASCVQVLGSNQSPSLAPQSLLSGAALTSAGYHQPLINIAKIVSTSQHKRGFSRLSNTSNSRRSPNSRFDSGRDRRPGVAPARRRSPPSVHRSPRPKSRSPSHSAPRRSRSPAKYTEKKSKPTPRYVVQLPKYSLTTKSLGVIEVKARYPNMYIPSDFFNVKALWGEAFPLSDTFQLGNPCQFFVMPKHVDRLVSDDAVYDPPDADYTYSVKVMLLSCPTLGNLYHKVCALADDPVEVQEAHEHPSRFIEFLVGIRNKGEPMAIGGPWSPSLDGPDPATNPGTLVNTAVRTTMALTGIDLTHCSKWCRFAEFRYMRPEVVHKTWVEAARVETVVFFLPDIWSCLTDNLEWGRLVEAYDRLQQSPDPVCDTSTQAPVVELEMDIAENSEMTRADNSGVSDDVVNNAYKEDDQSLAEVVNKEDNQTLSEVVTRLSEEEVKTMKVVDLKRELGQRNLSQKGLRQQLVARLLKSVKDEKEIDDEDLDVIDEDTYEEDKKATAAGEETVTPVTEETDLGQDPVEAEDEKPGNNITDSQAPSVDTKESVCIQVHKEPVTLPLQPCIVVHPSRTAKDGKFDCKSMSLSVLLDYRVEDTKEHIFQVSLFAEMFNDMLMRDQAYRIYKSLAAVPNSESHKHGGKDKSHDSTTDKKDLKASSNVEPEMDKTQDEDANAPKRKLETDSEDVSAKKIKNDSDSIRKQYEIPKVNVDENAKKEKETSEERRLSRHSEDKRSRTSDAKEDKITLNPDLLMAFIYFDQNQTGYLEERDVTDIINMVGLQLSRSQLKKVVEKAVARERLYYRRFTDFPRGYFPDNLPASFLITGNIPFLNQSQKPEETDEKGEAAYVEVGGSLVNIPNIVQQFDEMKRKKIELQLQISGLERTITLMKDEIHRSSSKNAELCREVDIIRSDLISETSRANSSMEKLTLFDSFLVRSQKSLRSLLDDVTGLMSPRPSDHASMKSEVNKEVKKETASDTKIEDIGNEHKTPETLEEVKDEKT